MIQASYLESKNAIAVTFPYDPQKVEIMREAAQSFKLGKSAWDPESKQWCFKFSALPFLLERIPSLTLSESLKAVWEEKKQAEVSVENGKSELKDKLLAAVDLEAPMQDGKILMVHQKSGVKQMLEEGSVILAGQPGTGKTLSALVYAKAFQSVVPNLRVIAIIKPYLFTNWKREAKNAGVEIECASMYYSKIPQPLVEPYVLLVDESHACKEPSSKITKAVLKLAEKSSGVVMMTGTPASNGRPKDLWTSLVAIKHPLARQGKKFFDTRFCAGQLKIIYVKGGKQLRVWDNSGASNQQELHDLIGSKMIVWKKNECLDLPPVSFTQIEIDFSGEEKKIFTRFYEERLKQAVEERRTALDEAKRAGAILTSEDEENALRVEAIAKDTFFRQAASLAKIKTAIEVAKDANLSGAQVLLFCAFKETAGQIAEALGCPCVTSDLAGAKRQKVVDDFQSGKHQNLVLTYGSGETGLNLQAASVVIRVDRVWLWASNEQSVARSHRLGQENKVTVYDLFFGEHDKEMWKVLEAKTENVLLLIGGEKKEFHKGSLAEIKSVLVKQMEERLGW